MTGPLKTTQAAHSNSLNSIHFHLSRIRCFMFQNYLSIYIVFYMLCISRAIHALPAFISCPQL